MSGAERPEWVVREDASATVLVALFLRQALGIRAPEELPHLRGAPAAPASGDDDDARLLQRQWLAYWAMAVEPQAHPSPVPLELVDGYETLAVLPVDGFDELRAAMSPLAADAVAFARRANDRYNLQARGGSASSYRAYASAIAEHERRVGRRAHSFELNVQVLPLTQRGVWWIGSLTIAVTDGLRGDVAAFDPAIQPIIAELA
ncbi:zinc-binding alcohol dehydrogenase [Microbacterium sp. EYE_5]|uniref:zinc-binding alcohol dehydrogenase n=1 Tax=unclassified Microbacterium TaxID=2609290 RepID=UPI002006116B|nr:MULTISPECIES: zinc-binding alcohol dehydrogenase [unclassified Microbacterium]MCK6079692.1 zinc-binding alcohol dehydrogenase [Microbacterium sp. EYE_382]MCK6084963.1 zinc-binding alcohol dehydrogenase [Microbacterium sp. EYE_384]MCK6122811.1 zinc-binding alcohol dehydrogenase [Microbacterium sp. EYE_80]MCK6125726.1 zinc-binding alcohol dehydrogenase [Microbacterium sp. EYE_79]MCK6140647.1 zinc-binding alcohol dehydrogenase [Microbacterium sp. EYE_39]